MNTLGKKTKKIRDIQKKHIKKFIVGMFKYIQKSMIIYKKKIKL